MNQKNIDGTIVGYDPGGNGTQGVANISISGSQCTKIEVCTLDTAEDVISWIDEVEDLIGLGVDTLACWSTGPSGWRAADLWLRKRYTEIQQSVVSPNGLYGSMGLNGMAVLVSIREKRIDLPISETHPKVLYWALQRKKYDYTNAAPEMDFNLSDWLASMSGLRTIMSGTPPHPHLPHCVACRASGHMICFSCRLIRIPA